MLILSMKHNMRSYNHQKSNLKFEKLKEIYDANKEINIIHNFEFRFQVLFGRVFVNSCKL
jgi:hypothetical protein